MTQVMVKMVWYLLWCCLHESDFTISQVAADLHEIVTLQCITSLQLIWSDRYLSLPTKVRVYQTLVLPVLTYACETWTASAADTRRLEAFHMKCQRQIARIRWQDHIRNTEVTTLTGLSPVSESKRRHNSLFGHVTRLAEDTPAHQALRCHVNMTLGRFQDRSWRRRPGRPRNRWLDQLHGDNNSSPVTFGDEPRHVDIRGWRYGPRRLRVNDDDECITQSSSAFASKQSDPQHHTFNCSFITDIQ